MKQNYQPTDEVKIINPDNFAYGFDGDVLSNNPDASKPLTIILRGGLGTWSYKYIDVALLKDNATQPAKSSDTPKQTVKEVGAQMDAEQKGKRSYKKRDKTEVKVIKRKYQKRAKP